MNGAGVGLDEVIIGLNTPFDHSLRLYPRTFSRIFVKKKVPSENVILKCDDNKRPKGLVATPSKMAHPSSVICIG